jgi:hypothetical protein
MVVVGPEVEEDGVGHGRWDPGIVGVVEEVPGAQIGETQVFWGISEGRAHMG